MRESDNIRAVSALGVDMIGYIFYPQSARYVKEMGRGEELNDGEPERVGVFVDEMPQTVITRVYWHKLKYIQLHGNETPTECENLRRTIHPDIMPNIKIIKTISVNSSEDIDKYKEYEGAVDMFLFDTKCPTFGGSGKKFDWTLLERYNGKTPFMLSGGIEFDDVEQIKNLHNPMFYGVDINSKFEVSPGVKDVEKLRLFVNEIRK